MTPFDIWWEQYPKKVSKIYARVAYDRAAKLVGDLRLLETVTAYRAATNNWATRKFIPYPASWLNAGKWDDDQDDWIDEDQQVKNAKRNAETRRLARIDAENQLRQEETVRLEAESREYWAKRKRDKPLLIGDLDDRDAN